MGDRQLTRARSAAGASRALPVLATALACLASSAAAQGGTDIYVATLELTADGATVGEPVNVTDRPGYDNQPHFLRSGDALFYVSIRDDGQADIYRHDLDGQATTRITSTGESEYSPTVMRSGRSFSSVRVEPDSAQRLWAFDLDGATSRLLFPNLAPVGYHGWVDDTTVVVFVLGDPATLRVAHLTDANSEGTIVAHDIGRTIAKVPGEDEMGFVQRVGDQQWLAVLDLTTMETRRLAVLPGAEFFAWLPDGSALAAQGSTILRNRRPGAEDWVPIADLAGYGLSGITRLAVSPNADRIAIVAAER